MAALIVLVALLGISWSFSMLHVHTQAYPLLWAAAMPALAVYYGLRRGTGRYTGHLTAGALSIYALVLFNVAAHYGRLGITSAIAGVLVSLAVLSTIGRVSSPAGRAASPALERPRRATARHRPEQLAKTGSRVR
jgi:hypothetical protein